MATKKRKATGGGLDRKIASVRKQLAAINAKKRAEKAARRKAATLAKLQNKLKSLKKR